MLRPLCIGLIENGFHGSVHTAEPVYDGLRPFKVSLAPSQVPICWWVTRHITQVTDLVRQLNQLRLVADMRGVLNLALLACGLFQSLVIGDISGSRKLK